MEPSGYTDRPDYRVDVHRKRNLVRVTHEGTTLAETTAALLVDEQDHGIVLYIPRADVRFEHLAPSEHTSRCPFKGRARYWRPREDPDPIAWEYPEPYTEVAVLRDHIAFYQDRAVVRIGTADPVTSNPPAPRP
ncbi:DUF427 domain-containing protein [Actinomadura livida]|uniref:DUF427 domain-containing protein n=1 Tax=Actinomadura livida TaxID=79909 RepID=A0A7W7IF91_9ACTN|nr:MULTISPECIES: DUF427 domain-containing protein [Actinomadura]MBB4775997.1 uncharacterized protein (DUF427 family) [Actinomadura catellatispora]GGU16226.1 hypothetical protein GCM10010208_46680 [Actinomadura livida]